MAMARRVPGRQLHRAVGGFTLIGMMIMVAAMGILFAGAGELWRTAQMREKERQLLFVGNQFRQALEHYYERTPGNAPRYPVRLEDLLKDPRVPGIQRHLRRVYRDPITGGEEWGLIRGTAGEILGVHSLSDESPLKTGNFALADRSFEGKTRYSEWLFMSSPR